MTIDLSYTDEIAVITLSRPEVLNAIHTEMAERLLGLLDIVEKDASVALVLTGAGRAFCAGSDLRQREADPAYKIRLMHTIVRRLMEFPKLSVAALNGLAMGGGLELALGCTLRVAHPSAQLGLPEIKLATIPSYGGTQLLPRLIGASRALAMMLEGEPINAREAVNIGLVSALDDEPVRRAIVLARSCAKGRQNAQRAIRSAVFHGWADDIETGLSHELELALGLIDEPEVHEAVADFFSRRSPK